MNARIAAFVVGLAALLAVAAPAPQPAAQAGIERLVDAIVAANTGAPAANLPAMAEDLQRRLGDDREELLRQLVVYLATHPGNEQTMGTALLIDSYRFGSDEKLAALLPHLDTDDDGLREAMWQVLGDSPDFAACEAALRESDETPVGLIDFMYAASPIDALVATARVYGDDDSAIEAVRRVRALDTLADLDRARHEVDSLSRDPAWWIRLYVSHVIRARPELGSPELARRLGSDAHELVRKAADGVHR